MTKDNKPKRPSIMSREYHKHPFVVPVVTLVILSFATLFGLVLLGGRTVGPSDAHIVRLNVDGKKQSIPTRATDVKDFLNRAKITLNDGDIVEPASESVINDDNFRINVYRARPVTIFDGTKRIQALSAATTARSVAAQAGIQTYPEDNLKQEVSNNVLRDQVIGDKITIDRATPANLNLYGTPVSIRTRAKTVAELLKEKNITLASGDSVQPDAKTVISANVQIFVTRNGTQIVTVEEAIPMVLETIQDPNLSFGATATRQQGSPGRKIVTYQLELQNGKEISRHVIQEVRVSEPVTKIIARGKAFDISQDREAIMAAAGVSLSNFPYVNYIITHEGGWDGVTKFNRAGSGAYGICQALPGSKMATAGSDWETNPVTQLKWCNGYANRYGGWEGSYNFWLSHNYW